MDLGTSQRRAGAVLVAAGGTGGHLFPGIAVADELRRRDAGLRVLFVGTPKGLETRLVPLAGYPLELLPILPLNGVPAAQALRGLLALPRALLRALQLVRRERPAAVLGVGGYAGGPLVLVAALLGVRTVILEPNARPGFTNRVLRPFVSRAACAYEPARLALGRKGVVTGNPVRGAFATIAREPQPAHEGLAVLIFGGSQGSRVLNRAVVAALEHLPQSVRIVHQTGPQMLDEVRAAYAQAGRQAQVEPFLDDMPRRFAEADLVLCRSGATSCAELTVAGKPAVLVPFAQAADDHQRVNALALKDAGAALMLEERELTGQALAARLTGLASDPARLRAMAEASRQLGRPDAAARVADLLELGNDPSPYPSPRFAGRGERSGSGADRV